MKINGRVPSGPNIVTLVLPRAEGEPFVFRAKAVTDYSKFEKFCPDPEPPKVNKRGQGWSEDYDDAGYKKAAAERTTNQYHWMVLESLSATEGLEWEHVKHDDPSTWKQWESELREAGFSRFELGRLHNAVRQANCLDDNMVEAARESFFANQSPGL